MTSQNLIFYGVLILVGLAALAFVHSAVERRRAPRRLVDLLNAPIVQTGILATLLTRLFGRQADPIRDKHRQLVDLEEDVYKDARADVRADSMKERARREAGRIEAIPTAPAPTPPPAGPNA